MRVRIDFRSITSNDRGAYLEFRGFPLSPQSDFADQWTRVDGRVFDVSFERCTQLVVESFVPT